mgnify:CR=1 FL=1
MENLKEILKEKFGENVDFKEERGELEIIFSEDILFDALKFLRENPFLFFDFLIDLTAVHYPYEEKKFAIVYHLYSFKFSKRIRVKSFLEEPYTKSATSIWKGASWPERETYDMFGIHFYDHPNLKRILLWEKFPGFPLRKDFDMDTEIPNPDFSEIEE